MKFFSKTLFFVLILGVGYYFRAPLLAAFSPAYQNIKSNISTTFFPQVACEEPIPYDLGNLDPKFKISNDYFLSALKDAEEIWEKPYGKELFAYTPDSTQTDSLKINLIYDYRQEATSKLKSLGIVVEDNKSTYNDLKAKLDALKISYDKQKNIFEARVARFNAEHETYQDEVDEWNKKGGAPKEDYDRLEAERKKLEAQSEDLQDLQDEVNSMADEINALVTTLNRLISVLNLSVDKYNTTNDARGESFQEGVYISDGANQEIDIYEFSSRAKLVRVLAHELGHALGLEHVKDPKAIMYEFNQGSTETLSATDLAALKAKCEVE